jgi:limonene-1,2-epoxide hydrolase
MTPGGFPADQEITPRVVSSGDSGDDMSEIGDPTSTVERRTFLGAAGLAGMAAFGGGIGAPPPSDAEQANMKVVAEFCAAWSTRDLAKILPFLSDDSVYRMTETTPPAIGHAGVRERLGSWLESSQQIEFTILETFTKGPVVVNHRIDRFISTTRPLTWEGVGVFFVKDGRIKEWSDYTINVVRPAV